MQWVFSLAGHQNDFYLRSLPLFRYSFWFIFPSVLPFASSSPASFLQNVCISSTALPSCAALPHLLCLLISYKAAICYIVCECVKYLLVRVNVKSVNAQIRMCLWCRKRTNQSRVSTLRSCFKKKQFKKKCNIHFLWHHKCSNFKIKQLLFNMCVCLWNCVLVPLFVALSEHRLSELNPLEQKSFELRNYYS